ncbi:DoxX family protein [Dactylosporangium sp. AC04546]|uniref:DoxX family protein n=1 Tax=Dactylosporangium sp. AC04546 TaxID=2862460 RepID=UPI001EDEEED7|nr:DoxX family protein [Dactylosporangium sp. AC04546]WVK85082.1 DoxX family protein [Dactylosporangium sp. AC04546]
MNVFLWVLQILLGVAFLGAGVMKSTQPKEKLAGNMTWVNRRSAGTVKFIGVMEILGGLGLILPWATDIAPILTPLAAVGLALVMVLAIADHVRAKEYPVIPVNLVLGALAVVIAIGRF